MPPKKIAVRTTRNGRIEVFTTIGNGPTEREIKIARCKPGVSRAHVLAAMSKWEPPVGVIHAALKRRREVKGILIKNNMLADTLSDRIQVGRGNRTQVDCAGEAGVSIQHWHIWEAGRTKDPELAMVAAAKRIVCIARGLRMDPASSADLSWLCDIINWDAIRSRYPETFTEDSK